MLTIKELDAAIEQFETTLRGMNYVDSEYADGIRREDIVAALTALCEYRERLDPAPLTLEELEQMDWVWLDNDTQMKNRGWAKVFRMYRAVKLEVLQYSFSNYGKTWLAYRVRPEGSTK